MIDLKESASQAAWFGGRRQFSPDLAVLRFGDGSAPAAENGFVQVSDEIGNETEDGRDLPYLHTHPASGRGGQIMGLYDSYIVQPGDRFRASVGFIEGAMGSDGVVFRFGYIPQGSRIVREDFFSTNPAARGNLRSYYRELSRITKRYTGSLTPIDVDLSFLAGQRVQFVLIVEAGTNSGQDWAAWVNPRIAVGHRITVRNLFCIAETTSGWSARRRRLRRERFSDEVALMVLMRGVDARRTFTDFGVTELRTSTGVDSAETVSVPPVTATFSNETARVLIWVKGLEIAGVGRTEDLAQTAFNEWAGYLFFHPNVATGDAAAHYSFSSAGNSGHDVLFEDYWAADLDNLRAGGVPADEFDVASRRRDGPNNVEEYLDEQAIDRQITIDRSMPMTIETRRYQARNAHSDYSFDVVYR